MDRQNTDFPTTGVIGMRDMLRYESHIVNVKRIRRLMRVMGIRAIYPKKSLSVCDKTEYVYPYLLRGKREFSHNEVWSIDISYIPMRKGFMYLTAIMDVSSRFIVGWALSNTLEARICTEVLNGAIERYGKPAMINSDQGTQFTCAEWVNNLKNREIEISMDGRGRAKDNIWIERFWRTIKNEYIYLNPADDGLELYEGVKKYMKYYDFKRIHQNIGHVRPSEIYFKKAA